MSKALHLSLTETVKTLSAPETTDISVKLIDPADAGKFVDALGVLDIKAESTYVDGRHPEYVTVYAPSRNLATVDRLLEQSPLVETFGIDSGYFRLVVNAPDYACGRSTPHYPNHPLYTERHPAPKAEYV